tara:strand:- start:7542 stop:10781 length:3240 start_codon:yes stop_codon:yes gene_type:complete
MSSYQQLTPQEHVELRPEMYIGNCETRSDELFVVNSSDRIVRKTCTTNDGLLKLYNEALDNAVDNTRRSPPTSHIQVSLSLKGDFVVRNNGAHIPVRQQNGVWIPTMIFSKPLSGSNFEDEKQAREGAGMNGWGIKLALMLSDVSSIEILDPVEGQKLVQSWGDGVRETSGPKVTKKKSKHSGWTTTVRFQPKLERFGIGEAQMSAITSQVETRLLQISATNGVKITFNGAKIQTNTFKKYVESFDCVDKLVYEKVNQYFEYGFALSDGAFTHQSFVNDLCTTDGGTHVKVVETQVVDALLEYFRKRHKGSVKLTRHAVRQRLFVFVNCRIQNPRFRSQSKVYLTTPISKSAVALPPKRIVQQAHRIGLLDQLEELLVAKEDQAMENAMSSKKKRSVKVDKLIDAAWAGGSKSQECSLYLTEGDSARTFVVSGLSKIGPKQNGVFPLRGKLLNCYSASKSQIQANKEIQHVVEILGLNLSKRYNTMADMATLRYGKIVILTDADVDGFHICGLILAFFQKFFPTLLKNGFVQRMITPVIVATKRQEKHEFFAMPDFERWYEGKRGYTIKYFKGLGSSTRQQAVAYFANVGRYLKNVVVDDTAVERIDLFFNDKRSADRKEWIGGENMDLDYDSNVQGVGQIVDSELKQFSHETLARAIPSMVDGLKESQRKIIFAAFQKFGASNQPFKIAQLASYTAEKTAYLHGETSLGNAITKMTQGFVGSNNVPLLVPEGQTGSRLQLGADAASTRYTFTRLQEYTRNIFHKDDDAILSYRIEEGLSIEPEYFFPVIPMILVNGAEGISVGYRSVVPQHSFEDVVKCMLNRLKNGSFGPLTPSWNGFKGTVTEDESAWYTHGVFEYTNSSTIVVTEIPVGVSTDKYTAHLQKLVEKSQIVRFTSAAPDENSIYFTLQVPPGFNASALKLTNSITKRCLNLLDASGAVQTFASVADVCISFYNVRFGAYAKRRRHLITTLKERLTYIMYKSKFIELVLHDKLDIKNTKAFLLEQAKHYDLPQDRTEEFLKLSILTLSKEFVLKLQEEQRELERALHETENTSTEQFYERDLLNLLASRKRKRDGTGS